MVRKHLGSKFDQFLVQEGFAFQTRLLYTHHVARCEEWLASNGRPALKHTSFADIQAWHATLQNTASTKSGARSALDAYWKYLGRHRLPGKLRVPTQKRYRSRALEPGQIDTVLAAAQRMGPLPHAGIGLAYYAALRRHEIAKMEWREIDPEAGWIRLVGKGNVDADIPLSSKLVAILGDVPRARSRFVFPSPQGLEDRPISNDTVQVWFYAIKAATGIHVSPHVLRHTAITDYNDGTGRIDDAQIFARHASIETTRGYTRVRTQRLREGVELL